MAKKKATKKAAGKTAKKNPEEQVTISRAEYDRLQRRAKHAEKCRKQARKIEELDAKCEAEKQQASATKKEYEKQVAILRRMELNGSDQLLLKAVEDAVESAENDTAAKPKEEDNSWRDVDLSSVIESESLLKKLEDNNPSITTMGHLTDWTKDHQLADIKGVGAAAATKIEDATIKFWEDRQNEKPQGSKVELIKDVGGLAPEGLTKGKVFDVDEWHDNGEVSIKAPAGVSVKLEKTEFKVVDDK